MTGTNGKLHVALLSYRGNMFCGGQGVYVWCLARALAQRGHRVRLLAGPPYPDTVPGVELVRVPNQNFINRPAHDLPRPDPLAVFEPLNLAEYLLARAGSNPEMLAFSLRCFQYLRKLHRMDPVDVVHDNQGLGYGLLLTRALGVPVVATIHHPLQVDRAEDIKQLAGLSAKMQRAVYYPVVMQRTVARRMDRVIAVSRFSADLITRVYGLDPARVAVAPNGVDPDTYRPDGRPREPGRLLFVGSTEDRKKGIIYLLEALAGLPHRFRLVIVDGRRYPGRVYAAEAVARLGLAGRVEFKDKITNAELVEEYNRAELMVVPSLFEGFGLPALEAMACGAPLVCAAAGALPEVVDPACARLVPARSAEALRRAIIELSARPEERARMSVAGRARAVSLFRWSGCAEKVEEQYRLARSARDQSQKK